MRRVKSTLCSFATVVVLVIVYLVGAMDHIIEKDFSGFTYPLNIDLGLVVKAVRSGVATYVNPINTHNYQYINKPSNKCEDDVDVTVIIKSAMANVEQRRAIRKTWGSESHSKGSEVRRVFLIGVGTQNEVQEAIDKEAVEFNDIVQTQFKDTYYNNTIKTMTGFKWAYEYCSNSRFYLFADDDMFISMKRLLMFVNNPSDFDTSKTKTTSDRFNTRTKDELYAGYVFHSGPLRVKTSKWYMPLQEYPWNKWPPYVTAGAYVVSNNVMINLYLASLFTKYFRFDDIYLAILAHKLNIPLTHCNEFYFRKIHFNTESNIKVIAAHGYTPKELLISWNMEKKYNRA